MNDKSPEDSPGKSKVRRTIKQLATATLVAISTVLAPTKPSEVRTTRTEESIRIPPQTVAFADFNWKEGDGIPILSAKLDETALSSILKDYLLRRSTHGDMVINTFTRTLGSPINISEIPRLNILSTENTITTSKDEVGNIGIFFEVNIDELNKFVASQKDTKIFNFSFQIGKSGVFEIKYRIERPLKGLEFEEVTDEVTKEQIYFPEGTILSVLSDGSVVGEDQEGNKIDRISSQKVKELKEEYEKENSVIVDVENPYLEEIGAFSLNNQNREQNFKKLVEFGNRFPLKTFVFSAGNNKDSYVDLGELPKNIILVGRLGERLIDNKKIEFSCYDVEGKGLFFVNNDKWDINTSGSSNSAPVMTALIMSRIGKGESIDQALSSIKGKARIWGDNYILDPEDISLK